MGTTKCWIRFFFFQMTVSPSARFRGVRNECVYLSFDGHPMAFVCIKVVAKRIRRFTFRCPCNISNDIFPILISNRLYFGNTMVLVLFGMSVLECGSKLTSWLGNFIDNSIFGLDQMKVILSTLWMITENQQIKVFFFKKKHQ